MHRWANQSVVAILIAAMGAAAAHAEVKVTVSISGSIDEVLPILRHLQDLGIGATGEQAMKLQVHSSMSAGETTPATLGFHAAAVEPVAAKVGDAVLITAKVGDPDHLVDTVAATVGGLTVDLYDNGTNGDAVALDGTWSRKVQLPAGLPAGEAKIAITAYDVSGDTIQVPAPNGTKNPMTTQAVVTVLPGAASAPVPTPAAAPGQPKPTVPAAPVPPKAPVPAPAPAPNPAPPAAPK